MKTSSAVKRAKTAYRLAKILGVSRQAISKWRDGDLPPGQVDKLRILHPEWFRREGPSKTPGDKPKAAA